MSIGNKIKKARKSKGLTQEKLGEKIGVSAAMIAAWENGKRNPKSETIEKIANALDVPVWELRDFKELETFYEITKINNHIGRMTQIGNILSQVSRPAEYMQRQLDATQSFLNNVKEREKRENYAYKASENLILSQGYEIIIENDDDNYLYLKKNGKKYKVYADDLFSLHDTTIDYFKYQLDKILQKSEKVEDIEDKND